MIKLTLKDGSVREVEENLSAAEIVKGIGAGLYKAACCCKIDGKVCDLRTAIAADCVFEVLTFDSKEGKETFWHTASHLMAQAVKSLFPEAKLARGPSTETGFYYDFKVAKPFSPDDLKKIEDEMKKLAKEGFELEHFELSLDEATKLMSDKNEDYKVKLIHKHDDKGEKLSFYQQGDFVDLCAGPHLLSVAPIKAVKLISCTGAYWGKAEDGDQLSRIYGTAFPKASELEAFLKQQDEAKLRDHNKLGRELEYFTTVDYIGQGLPIMLPKGAKVIQILQRFVEDEEERRGWKLTKTPLMAKSDLYKISGHWDHYRDGMFVMGDPNDETKECFALRPMTCPFQYQVFLNRQRSYRDLPMRLDETSTLFRNEDSGEMHGLIRVRQFTISEGHLMCTPDQLEDEFKQCIELAKFMLEKVGLIEDVSYRFSKWDPNNREKYIGTVEQWDEAQGVMEKILNHLGIDYSIGIDEAAFYGPKLDIQIKNVFGKEDTLITIQIDQMLAQSLEWNILTKTAQKRTHTLFIGRQLAVTRGRLP
ncbi:MAG: threonine--tRNA ligase [Oscillospiraceae bacterium]